jgi:hypothetical protein
MGRSRRVIRVDLNGIYEQLMHPSMRQGELGNGGRNVPVGDREADSKNTAAHACCGPQNTHSFLAVTSISSDLR